MQVTLWIAGLSVMTLLVACGNPEPVATGYKRQLESGAATTSAPVVPPATTTPPASGNNTAIVGDVARGQALYSKCVACHQPLATTAKPNKTAAQLEAVAPPGFAAHASVTEWPTGQAAADLAAALKK